MCENGFKLFTNTQVRLAAASAQRELYHSPISCVAARCSFPGARCTAGLRGCGEPTPTLVPVVALKLPVPVASSFVWRGGRACAVTAVTFKVCVAARA
jgi:hypothetical protein